MALTDRLNDVRPAAIKGSPCSVGVLLDTLDVDDRDALLLMLGNTEQPGWTAGDIYDAVTAEGHKIGFQTINRHRGRKCRCFR